ncbi:TPA: hypothetical protein N0F65_001867 [Lagenidium giganteum]|uniref:Non-specific serine/threonine protein kinase n=1 Tax=Lagenidium giganteum TaxID=4803 RepID=A0AAV2YZQ0_9STRA|nr:TPA: hypothetical protein N0F65_001867 [Lagenidium giganteum]
MRQNTKISPMSATTLRKYLDLLYVNVRNEIKALLPQNFGLVLNGWTSNGGHFVAVMAIYDDPALEGFLKPNPDPTLTLAGVGQLFDHVLKTFPSMKDWLGPSANVVNDPTLESGIVMLIVGDRLTAAERNECTVFRSSDRCEVPILETSFAVQAFKKRKKASKQSFMFVAWVPPHCSAQSDVMALDRELRRLLQRAYLPEKDNEHAPKAGAQPEDDRVSVQDIYAQLTAIAEQSVVPSALVPGDCNLPELLILVAEAALHQRDFAIAGEAVMWYCCEARAKNQLYCRAMFVRARCEANDARRLTGANKLRRVLNALHFILLVLPIALDPKKRPSYDFLVYNASVNFWRTARGLMKKTTFQYLLPSLQTIIEALKMTNEKDVEWLIRLQLALVYAQVDGRQYANAAKTINDVVDVQLAPLIGDPQNESLRALYEEALRLQIHVGSLKDPECQKIIPNLKKTLSSTTIRRPQLLLKLQSLRSNAVPPEAVGPAILELFQDVTALTIPNLPTATEQELLAIVNALSSAQVDGIDGEILAKLAIFAATTNEVRLARCADVLLQLKGKNMPPRPRILHQVLKGVLQAVALVPSHIPVTRLSAKQRHKMLLQQRIETMKTLERALIAAKRLDDANLVETICVYVWNLALPLLQPKLRKNLIRLFELSIKVLEQLESLQLNLRVRMCLEAAKSDIMADFLAKAMNNVNQALSLDYGTLVTTATTTVALDDLTQHEDKWLKRPVDLHLFPLRRKLFDKLTLEDVEAPEDRLIQIVEQFRESKDSTQRRNLLEKGTTLVEEMMEQHTILKAAPAALVDFVLLSSDMSVLAWRELHDPVLARKIAEDTLRWFFGVTEPTGPSSAATGGVGNVLATSGLDKSIMMLEVDLRFVLVEVLAHTIKMQVDRMEKLRRQRQLAAEKEAARRTTHGSANVPPRTAATRSRQDRRKADEIEIEALLQFSKHMFVLGVNQPWTSTNSSATPDEVVDAERRRLEEQLVKMKRDILAHLTQALVVANRLGWVFSLENTCVYVWNYHFHIFRMLAMGALEASAIFPEFIAALETACSQIETLAQHVSANAIPGTMPGLDSESVNQETLANLSLGLAIVYEKQARQDKVIAVCDNFLKKKATLVSIMYLKKFAELKSRVQLLQNAKEIVPVENHNVLKVVGLVEAMEGVLAQATVAAANASAGVAPTAGQPTAQQLLEKAQGFFQKASTLWFTTAANELVEAQKQANHCLGAEEDSQQLELLIEVWIRLGCGAFRLQNFKLAIECVDNALAAIGHAHSDLTKAHQRWACVAEILFSRAVLALVSGESVALQLVVAAMEHLASAAAYGIHAVGAGAVLHTLGEVAWNALVRVLASWSADSNSNQQVDYYQAIVSKSREILQHFVSVRLFDHASALVGDLALLTLELCERSGQWKPAYDLCEEMLFHQTLGNAIMAAIPPLVQKEICTYHAIAGANLGSAGNAGDGSGAAGSGGSGGSSSSGNTTTHASNARMKDPDPLLQARILRRIAFSSSKHPGGQLKALSNAYKELDERPEPQAVALVDIAEWFHAHLFPRQEVDNYLLTASNILRACQAKAGAKAGSRNGGAMSAGGSNSSASGATGSASSNAAGGGRSAEPLPAYSPLWFTEQHIRIHTVLALNAPSLEDRWRHAKHALTQVHEAWHSIIDLVNEQELQDQYAKEVASATASGAPVFDFEQWKVNKPVKFDVPHRYHEWVTLYQQHEKSQQERFHQPWSSVFIASILPASKASLKSPVHHINQPTLFLACLETLAQVLRELACEELVVPIWCLFQFVRQTFVPQKVKTIDLWLDLTLALMSERLNLSVHLIPLQNALDCLQSQGAAILREISQLGRESRVITGSSDRRRQLILQTAHLDVVDKACQAVQLLVQFGYVRQGKVLLSLVDHACPDARVGLLHALHGLIHEKEGNLARAAEDLDRACATEPIGLYELTEWTVRWCDIQQKLRRSNNPAATTDDRVLQRVEQMERTVASAVLTNRCKLLAANVHTANRYLSRLGTSETASDGAPIDAIVALARLKVARAKLLVHRSNKPTSSTAVVGSASTGSMSREVAVTMAQSTDALLDQLAVSKTVFREATTLLHAIGSKIQLSRWTFEYANELMLAFPTTADVFAIDRWKEARQWMLEALYLHELARSRWLDSTLGMPSDEPTATGGVWSPRDSETATLKLQVAKLDLAIEGSSAIVQAQELTWYSYQAAERRNLVEQWLFDTAPKVQGVHGGDLASAMVQASSALALLRKSVLEEHAALAHAICLKAQRLALWHSGESKQKLLVQRMLWTHYSCQTARHATWVVCQSGLAASPPVPQPPPQQLQQPQQPQQQPQQQSHNGGEEAEAAPTFKPLEDLKDEVMDKQIAEVVALLQAYQRTALEKRHVELLQLTSFELCQWFGCRSPLESVKNLLYYQSTIVQTHMLHVYEQCASTKSVTRMHMGRVADIQRFHSNAAKNSLPFQLSQAHLDQQSDAWKRLSVNVPVDTIVQAILAPTRLVALQFSPDRCFLYAAMWVPMMDKNYAFARMECLDTAMDKLTHVIERIHAWRQNCNKLLLAYEEQHRGDDEFEWQVVDTEDSASQSRALLDPDALEKEFSSIIVDMNELFAPLFAHATIMAELRNETTAATPIILMVDPDLAPLPLEALTAFERAESITRELSIHVLHQRLQALKVQPFRREDIRCIVDPNRDDVALTPSDSTMVSLIQQLTRRAGAPFPSWKDAIEHTQLPSSTDWLHALIYRRGCGTLYLGGNRVTGTYVTPQQIAGLNISSSVHLLMLLDRCENATSARRQSKADSEKQLWQVELEEDPYATAILWTLSGVSTLVLNQHTTTFSANRRCAGHVLSHLGRGASVGKAIKRYADTLATSAAGVIPAPTPTSSSSTVGPGATAPAAASATAAAAPAGLNAGAAGASNGSPGGEMTPPTRYLRLKNRVRYNPIVYGLAHLALKSTE